MKYLVLLFALFMTGCFKDGLPDYCQVICQSTPQAQLPENQNGIVAMGVNVEDKKYLCTCWSVQGLVDAGIWGKLKTLSDPWYVIKDWDYTKQWDK